MTKIEKEDNKIVNRSKCTKRFQNVEKISTLDDDEVYIGTEMLLQSLMTLLFVLLVIFCEYIIGESLYLNKTLFLITLMWTHIPSMLMFFDMKKYKLKALVICFLGQIIILLCLYYRRNRLVIFFQNGSKAFTDDNLNQIAKVFSKYPSSVVIITGATAKKEFVSAMYEFTQYEDVFYKYFTHNEKLQYKMNFLLQTKSLANLTGYQRKLLYIYESADSYMKNSRYNTQIYF